MTHLSACGHPRKIKPIDRSGSKSTAEDANSGDAEKAKDAEATQDAGAVEPDATVVEPSPPPPVEALIVDGASAEELAIVKQCVTKFQDNPFAGHITSFRKIVPLPSFNEDKVVIDDFQVSQAPTMILITDGLNVGGNVTFKLLDANGYYCIKPAAMVQNLVIQLDCKARIADANDQKGQGSIQGIYISSVTKIEKIDSGRGDCIR
jgi:hypothetical protein